MSDEWAALVGRHLDADYCTEVLVRLLRTPTDVPLGETELAPEDPKLARYVREIVRPELERWGFDRIAVDASNNLVCRTGADVASPSLLLMGYAVAQHANLMADPYSGRVANGREYGLDEPCAFGQAATQHKGALAAALAPPNLQPAGAPRLPG